MFFEIEEIKRKRKKLGITQKKLAELVGVSQPLIARIESGNLDPKLSLVRKIFEVLEELEGKSVNARSIMNSPVKFVTSSTTLREAIEIMMEDGISQMPVMDNGRVVGSITEGAVVRLILEKGVEASAIKVKECMEPPFPIISPDERLETISKMLLGSPALLVAEGDRIVGIITKHDVMKALKE
ncbi:CBS domain-containing protein [Archaeoglobus veneficus]|uniref:Transcriptional regulator, XRE family n=1 Tax=Archaeoglobus veneficus (strain DSM 11195 / SNP6) TaxID=693661 RepID=F2KMI6_ARCVS|nr:CBS domain-containing protein [Archaeoglobus veneficus]AEA47183.1 transcriptional regulator, XRE family [Archaeoglobus veneficus SNP6]